MLRSRDHRLGDDDCVRADGLDRVGVERLCHAHAHDRTLHDEFLPGGKSAAERKHHDASETDADDEHPGLPVAENPRGLGGAVDAHDGVVDDEGAGDRGHETCELTDDLLDDRGLCAGRCAGRTARDRKERAEDLGGPVIAWIEGSPAHIVGIGGLGQRGCCERDCGNGGDEDPERAHDNLLGFPPRLSWRGANGAV